MITPWLIAVLTQDNVHVGEWNAPHSQPFSQGTHKLPTNTEFQSTRWLNGRLDTVSHCSLELSQEDPMMIQLLEIESNLMSRWSNLVTCESPTVVFIEVGQGRGDSPAAKPLGKGQQLAP